MISNEADKSIVAKNRKASFDYFFIDTFEAGIVLTGTEIKAARQNKLNINDAYCVAFKEDILVRNMNIDLYDEGTYYNHTPRRDRILLLNKKEIKKISTNLKDKGIALIVREVYLNKKGILKLLISLSKGKKNYDKRQDIKQKDISKQLKRKLI
jgi:SsrA-binding protein